jgi:UDP-N-acetylglucosamine:LPS N-acetylglucosamine transferase
MEGETTYLKRKVNNPFYRALGRKEIICQNRKRRVVASMQVFVTVGSTRFDSLVRTILSEPLLLVLHSKRYSKLVVQRGNSQLDPETPSTYHHAGVDIEIWQFKDSLNDDYEQADLVISHAGR